MAKEMKYSPLQTSRDSWFWLCIYALWFCDTQKYSESTKYSAHSLLKMLKILSISSFPSLSFVRRHNQHTFDIVHQPKILSTQHRIPKASDDTRKKVLKIVYVRKNVCKSNQRSTPFTVERWSSFVQIVQIRSQLTYLVKYVEDGNIENEMNAPEWK